MDSNHRPQGYEPCKLPLLYPTLYVDIYVAKNIIVSNQYNQLFFNDLVVIDNNNIKNMQKIKYNQPFNTKIIANSANIAAIQVDIACTLYSNLSDLKSGAIAMNPIAIGQRNAKN